jgi:hypothetical protein
VLVNAALFSSYLIGFALVVRSVREGHFQHYSFFLSYFIYYLGTGVAGWGVLTWLPNYYSQYFWIRFLTLVIAEFAALVEIGNHVFRSRLALRALGRFVTIGVAGFFLAVYTLPPLLDIRPEELAVYDLVKRAALTKAVIAILLVAVAKRFRVPLGKNIAGVLLGLMSFLAINVANFALVEKLGWDAYGQVFASIGPLSQTLMVLIWLVSLWKYEPAPATGVSLEPLPERLAHYDTSLERLLRR